MEYAHIVKTPGTCAGRPRIDGTRIAVDMVVEAVVHLGGTPQEYQRTHPHVTLAQIHSALAYYYDHREEIDDSIRQGKQLAEELRERFPPRMPHAGHTPV